MEEVLPLWVVNPLILKYDKKYIYGTDYESAQIFFKLLSEHIRVDGFIDEELKTGRIWNKPIYGVERLTEENDVLLISPQKRGIEEGDYCICTDLNVLNPVLKSADVYIYGAGKVGEFLLEKFEQDGINVKGFIDSDRNKFGKKILGKDIYGKEILCKLTADQAVVEAGKFYKEIDAAICELQCDAKRFCCKCENDFKPRQYNGVVLDDKKAVRLKARIVFLLANIPCGKKVILWGNDIELVYKYYEILEFLDFNNLSIVSDRNMGCTKGIEEYQTIEEVLYEKDFLILICDEYTEWHKDKMQKLGLKYGRDYALFDDPQVVSRNENKKQILDINLGYTIKMNYEYPGFYILGENKIDDYKIAILGGSTSEVENYWFKSWSEIFYEQYCGKNISIINGAVSGYNSAFELLKLIRDLVYLKPDMLIVYDGVNDINRFENRKTNLYDFMYLRQILCKVSGKTTKGGHSLMLTKMNNIEIWEGINNQSSNTVDEWLMNIRYMHAVAEINSIKFYSFLQPMLFSKPNPVTLCEASLMKMNEIAWTGNLYKKECQLFRQCGKSISDKYEYIFDLSHIFDDVDVYIDDCHVYEHGNSIIAKEIYDIVKNDLPQ